MSLVKPRAGPGFLSQATQVQAVGNWYAGNLVRWRIGLLEKMDGWRRLIEQSIGFVVRRLHAWLDLGNRKNLLIAADDGVHLLVDSTLYPMGHGALVPGGYIVEIGDPGNSAKFSVTSGSTEVTVKAPAVASLGQTFVFLLPISIGRRIIPAGTFFTVKALVSGGFTFDMTFPATATETDVKGLRLFNNNILNQLTCTWNQHGLSSGATIRFEQLTVCQAGAPPAYEKINFSADRGISLPVVSATVDTFVVDMGAVGTGDGSGDPQHQFFDGEQVVHKTGDAGPSTLTLGNVIGLVEPMAPGNPQSQAWFLANMGQDGLALQAGGPLQVYKPPVEQGPFLTTVGSATVPPTAPQKSNGMLVAMPQAQVILWGSSTLEKIGDGTFNEVQDPLLIVWSNVGRYDDYRVTVSTQSGQFRLSRGSRIMGAIQAPQATMILTDTDLWLMSYIGPPLIYGFTIIGSGCGLAAPHAIATLGRVTIWQGQKNFWIYDSAVQPLACTVWDYIFKDIDSVNINKCHAAPNSTTNEMAFYFPSKKTPINVDRNLLLSSQDFTAANWKLINAVVQKPSSFEIRYVYEPQFLISGWLDDAGMSVISWFDRDLQSRLENVILAPDATDTATLLMELAVNGMHSLGQNIRKVSERKTYTLSLYVHTSSTRNLALRAVSSFGEVFATFNAAGNLLDAGTTNAKFSLIKTAVLPNDVGAVPGWRRYVLTFTSDDASSLDVFFTLADGADGKSLVYLGVPPKGALIWGAQLVEGGEPLAYQKTGLVSHQNETRFYVKVNAAEGMAWDSGVLGRSAWLDESVWGPPLGADITPIPTEGQRVPVLDEPIPTVSQRNLIQQHEIGYDDDDEPMQGVFAETGYTELGDGTAVMLCDEVHPDLKWSGRDGGVKISLRAANYPQGPTHLYGPYSMTPTTQWFTPRVRARYIAVRYDWEPRFNFSARIGVTTFKVKPAGKMP